MSKINPNYLVSEEIYTHEYLWRIANLMLNEAISNEKIGHYFLFSTLLMYYMAFEGFINFCGFVLLPEIWGNEKECFKGKGIEGKISLLKKKLPDFVWEKGKRPYQSIYQLKEFRDMIAHAKVKRYQYKTFSTKDGSHIKWEIEWNKFLTIKQVNEFMDDIKAFCQSLLESMRKVSDHPHLMYEAFEGSLASSSGHSI